MSIFLSLYFFLYIGERHIGERQEKERSCGPFASERGDEPRSGKLLLLKPGKLGATSDKRHLLFCPSQLLKSTPTQTLNIKLKFRQYQPKVRDF